MSLFITLEGTDGSGKSTQARLLARALRSRGYRVTDTREPGGTPLGERVRTALFDSDAPPKTPMAVALLYAASRAQLVSDVIRPRLKAGDIVVADRYADSTLAYQAFGQGLDLHDMRSLVALATGGLMPDLTLYIDVPPAVAMARMDGRGETNWLDAQSEVFHSRVRHGYLRLAAQEPSRWRIIEGTAAADAVHCAILESVERELPKVTQAI